jgi:hypothetical protein
MTRSDLARLDREERGSPSPPRRVPVVYRKASLATTGALGHRAAFSASLLRF